MSAEKPRASVMPSAMMPIKAGEIASPTGINKLKSNEREKSLTKGMSEEHLNRVSCRSSFWHASFHRHVHHERPIDASSDECGKTTEPGQIRTFQAAEEGDECKEAKNELSHSADLSISRLWLIRVGF